MWPWYTKVFCSDSAVTWGKQSYEKQKITVWFQHRSTLGLEKRDLEWCKKHAWKHTVENLNTIYCMYIMCTSFTLDKTHYHDPWVNFRKLKLCFTFIQVWFGYFPWGHFWLPLWCHQWWLQQKQSSRKCYESVIQYFYRLESGFFSPLSTLPPAAAFQPPPCCTVSALEIEISSSNCGKIVSKSLNFNPHISLSFPVTHDMINGLPECVSLSLLMAAPLAGSPLSSHRVSFLIHLPLFSTSSTKWPNCIQFRDFKSFHLPLSFIYCCTHLRRTLHLKFLAKKKKNKVGHFYTLSRGCDFIFLTFNHSKCWLD